MPRTISTTQFGADAMDHLREVERTGEALIVADRGRPIVRIEPYAPADDLLASLRGCVLRYDDPLEPVGTADWNTPD